MKYETAFARAWGRAPTPGEVEQHRRIMAAYDVDDGDALMALTGVLQVFHAASRESLAAGVAESRDHLTDCSDTIRQTLDDWLSSSGQILVDVVAKTMDQRLEKMDERLDSAAARYASAARRAWQESETREPRHRPIPPSVGLMIVGSLLLHYVVLAYLPLAWTGCIAFSTITAGYVWHTSATRADDRKNRARSQPRATSAQ